MFSSAAKACRRLLPPRALVAATTAGSAAGSCARCGDRLAISGACLGRGWPQVARPPVKTHAVSDEGLSDVEWDSELPEEHPGSHDVIGLLTDHHRHSA